MSLPALVRFANGRLGVRVDADTVLAVPHLPNHLSRESRRQVFDAILRRQPGLAKTLIDIDVELYNASSTKLDRRAAELVSELPFGGAWNLGA